MKSSIPLISVLEAAATTIAPLVRAVEFPGWVLITATIVESLPEFVILIARIIPLLMECIRLWIACRRVLIVAERKKIRIAHYCFGKILTIWRWYFHSGEYKQTKQMMWRMRWIFCHFYPMFGNLIKKRQDEWVCATAKVSWVGDWSKFVDTQNLMKSIWNTNLNHLLPQCLFLPPFRLLNNILIFVLAPSQLEHFWRRRECEWQARCFLRLSGRTVVNL